MKNFKGKGKHSVSELESIITEQQKLLQQKQAANEKLVEALTRIEKWELPATGEFWDKEKTRPVNYETNNGSNGARDYIRSVAMEAIVNNQIEALHGYENKLNTEMTQLDKRKLQLNHELTQIKLRKEKVAKAVSLNMKFRNKLIGQGIKK